MRRAFVLVVACCSCGWNPSRPFERDAPQVSQALAALDAGEAGGAATKLEEYLSTGPCQEGSIGTPDLLRKRPDGTLDLGLSLFRVGEHYGRRFGEEDVDAGVDDEIRGQRHSQVECGRRIVESIAADPSVPVELRAKARYLEGNLAFLDRDYEGAVREYDRALVLSPGEVDAADSVGRDAAWNRAIALRRIEEQKDAGTDASNAKDGSKDGAGEDASKDASKDGGGDGKPDGGGREPDAGGGKDAASPPASDASPERPDAGAPPPASRDQDERMLDQLENAPTLQQEEAKRQGKRRVRGMADK